MCQLINNFCTFKLLLTHVHTHLSQCVSMPSCIRAYSDVFFLGMPLKTSHASTANLVTGDPPPPSHTRIRTCIGLGLCTIVTMGQTKLRGLSVFIIMNVKETSHN